MHYKHRKSFIFLQILQSHSHEQDSLCPIVLLGSRNILGTDCKFWCRDSTASIAETEVSPVVTCKRRCFWGDDQNPESHSLPFGPCTSSDQPSLLIGRVETLVVGFNHITTFHLWDGHKVVVPDDGEWSVSLGMNAPYIKRWYKVGLYEMGLRTIPLGRGDLCHPGRKSRASIYNQTIG